jgi:Cu/Ag efflux pump CusA
MKRLIQWSIDHHWMVMAMSVLLLLGGIWTARDMPVDVFPDLTAPTVTILTEGRGMAPDEMEALVTFPLESAINGASGVRRVRSATALGVAVVWVEFEWGTDIFLARQIVAEKLALVGSTLPPQVERPVLAPVSSIMGEILFFAISSDTHDPLTVRTIADTVVRRRLLAVSGVSQVTPIGGAERQYQVVAHPEQLRANGVSLTELLEAVRGASQNTSAGVYVEGPQEYVLQAVGRVRSPEEIGETAVALRAGRSILVRDLADVREGGALKRGEGSRNGKPAVIVGIQKQPGANTIELTSRLDRELDALQQELPRGMTIDRKIFRQSDFIEVAVENVVKALRDGGESPRRRDHLDRDAAVTGRGHPHASRVRCVDQHDDARRHGDRDRRARGRRDHRCGERRAPFAREPRQARGAATARRRGRSGSDTGNQNFDRLRDGHHRPRLPANLRAGGG